ncbi:hypothetical protein [Streptomyces sp. NPDC058092]|uniref:hypothetical protein n=1 Tax=Streptomyces sp. NPDC058092 TaxID=3346336 RepID=UPI0036E5803D
MGAVDVRGVAMPSAYTSAHSVADAEKPARLTARPLIAQAGRARSSRLRPCAYPRRSAMARRGRPGG